MGGDWEEFEGWLLEMSRSASCCRSRNWEELLRNRNERLWQERETGKESSHGNTRNNL